MRDVLDCQELTDQEIRRTAVSLRLSAKVRHLLQAPTSGLLGRRAGPAKALRDDIMADLLRLIPRT